MQKRYTKNPVGAHYGVRDWLLQRLTAVVMAGYTIFVILAILLHRPLNYPAWRSVFSEMWFQVGTMLFVASLLYHAWVGMRDIVMDYLKPAGLRLVVEAGIALVLIGYAVWGASILWGMR